MAVRAVGDTPARHRRHDPLHCPRRVVSAGAWADVIGPAGRGARRRARLPRRQQHPVRTLRRRFPNAVLSRWPARLLTDEALPRADGSPGHRRVVAAAVSTPWGAWPIASTHLDHRFDDSAARQLQCRRLLELASQWRGDPTADLPVNVGADLNAVSDSAEVRMLTGREPGAPGIVFSDAWEQVGDGPGATWSTTNPYSADSAWPNRRIDYVLVSWPRPKPTGNPITAELVGTGPVDVDGTRLAQRPRCGRRRHHDAALTDPLAPPAARSARVSRSRATADRSRHAVRPRIPVRRATGPVVQQRGVLPGRERAAVRVRVAGARRSVAQREHPRTGRVHARSSCGAARVAGRCVGRPLGPSQDAAAHPGGRRHRHGRHGHRRGDGSSQPRLGDPVDVAGRVCRCRWLARAIGAHPDAGSQGAALRRDRPERDRHHAVDDPRACARQGGRRSVRLRRRVLVPGDPDVRRCAVPPASGDTGARGDPRRRSVLDETRRRYVTCSTTITSRRSSDCC